MRRKKLNELTREDLEENPISVHWVEYQMINTGIRESHYFQITFYAYHLKRKHFMIDDMSRPSYEVCYAEPFEGVHVIGINDKQLGETEKQPPKTYPVYVQSHALNRLTERLDRVGIELIRDWFTKSIIECKAFKVKNGNYFIEFNFDNKMVGYLVAGLRDEHLLIHTFLFITNNGSPEGNRLLAKT